MNRGRRLWVVTLVAPLLASVAAAEEAKPWRLRSAAGAPEWLDLGLEHRLRYERLNPDFRGAQERSSDALALRTLLPIELRFQPVVVGVELLDARTFAPRRLQNTTLTNPLDVLQAYVGVRLEGVSAGDDVLDVRAGRLTVDLGSRRLVARNRYRNTINAFTGMDASWTWKAGESVRAFGLLPVVRLPADAQALFDQELFLDQENERTLLVGAAVGTRPVVAGVRAEAYVVSLNEKDRPRAPSANRRLHTPGLRLVRPSAPGALDLELEGMYQLGKSRASSAASDERDLDHRAHAFHATVGYQFDAAWKPRAALEFDRATGDRSPTDDSNERFDPLFGARRFDFGPTGTWGAVARTNVNSPGLRLEASPASAVTAMTSYRLVWLASSRDAWTPAPLRDTSGASGTFVGHHAELQLVWKVVPKNLTAEVGGAALIRGDFARDAPNARTDTPLYAYAQLTLTL